MRTKKAIINYLTEIIPQILILILGFFKVKVFITYLGVELVGLFQLFNQLLYYLSLLDGGAGTIIGYYLYKPISKNDNVSIGRILSATIKLFSLIGFAVLLLGLIMDINIMIFIKDATVDAGLIKLMFMILLVSNVLSYFYTPYTLFMDAKQERYRYNIIVQPIMVIKSILEIVLVLHFKNLFIVLFMQLIMTLIQNFIVRIIFRKHYGDINIKEKADFGFVSQIKTIIPHKIGSIIANNIDIVIVSKFIAITKVVTYSSYLYITEVIQKFVDLIAGAVLPGVGNVIALGEKKAYCLFNEYNDFLYYSASVLCIPLFMSISIFVRIYYGENVVATDTVALLFVLILYYKIIRNGLNTFVSAAGLFKQTIKCVFLEAILNLTLSLVLVHYVGMAGLLFATLIAYIISEYLIKPNLLNKIIFKEKKFNYYRESIKSTFIFALLLFIVNSIFSRFNNIDSLLVWFLYSLQIFIINFIVVTIIYKLLKKDAFMSRAVELVKGKFHHGKS